MTCREGRHTENGTVVGRYEQRNDAATASWPASIRRRLVVRQHELRDGTVVCWLDRVASALCCTQLVLPEALRLQSQPAGLFIAYSTFQSLTLTICTTSLTFSNSTFCPHSVFMCFVWISEQTAIISLYSIN